MKTCSLDGCDHPHRARGFCSTHYNRSAYTEQQRRESHLRTIECDWCGSSHLTSRSNGRFCSRECATSHQYREVRDRKLPVHVGPSWPYSDLPPQHPARRPAPRKSEWWRLFVAGACRSCGEYFVAPAASLETASLYCSDRCLRRRARTIRRARKYAVESEPYTMTEIALRDKRTCQLCGKRVAMTKAVPHSKAATIDHVVPISEGGGDIRANVQLAHFLCNALKGARGSQQLALIG